MFFKQFHCEVLKFNAYAFFSSVFSLKAMLQHFSAYFPKFRLTYMSETYIFFSSYISPTTTDIQVLINKDLVINFKTWDGCIFHILEFLMCTFIFHFFVCSLIHFDSFWFDSQWPNVRMEISDNWCLSRVSTGPSAL